VAKQVELALTRGESGCGKGNTGHGAFATRGHAKQPLCGSLESLGGRNGARQQRVALACDSIIKNETKLEPARLPLVSDEPCGKPLRQERDGARETTTLRSIGRAIQPADQAHDFRRLRAQDGARIAAV
jgi:hypothetical protein